MAKKLYRSRSNRVLAGVCAGIADYFDLDPVLVRVIAVLTLFIGSAGFWAYVIMWIVVPTDNG